MFSVLCYGFQRGAFHHAQVVKQLIPFVGIGRLSIQQRIDGGVIEAGRPAHADAPLRQKLNEQIDGLSVLRPIGVFGLAQLGKDVDADKIGRRCVLLLKEGLRGLPQFPSRPSVQAMR